MPLRFRAPQELIEKFNLPALSKAQCRQLVSMRTQDIPILVMGGVAMLGRTMLDPRVFKALKDQKLVEAHGERVLHLTPLGLSVSIEAQLHDLRDVT